MSEGRFCLYRLYNSYAIPGNVTRIDQDTGEIQLAGVREETGNFPVFWGSMFFSWIIMGILNCFTDKLAFLFGLQPESP